MPIDLTKEQTYSIKTFMAFVLRHKPHFYRIKLDNDGYADIGHLLSAINKNKKINLEKEQLIDIAKRFSGGIFNVTGDRIAAKSGHTVIFNMRVPDGFSEALDVPNTLFCLVDKADIVKMVGDGGLSFANNKITLSKSPAISTSTKSAISISSQKAKSEKVRFYYSIGSDSFFVHYIPSKFVSMHV